MLTRYTALNINRDKKVDLSKLHSKHLLLIRFQLSRGPSATAEPLVFHDATERTNNILLEKRRCGKSKVNDS